MKNDDLEDIKSESQKVVRGVEVANSRKKDTETRSLLAEVFAHYFFRILIVIIIAIPLYNVMIYHFTRETSLLISLKDIILTYSAVLGSTFGLVVAYYFQSKEK